MAATTPIIPRVIKTSANVKAALQIPKPGVPPPRQY